MTDPVYTEVYNGNLYGDLTQLPTVFDISVGDAVKVTIDSNEKDYTVIAEDFEGIALRCFGTDTFANFLSSSVTDGFIFLTYTLEGQSQTFEIAAGTYVGKKAVVKALMTTAVVIPKKYLDTDLLDTYVFTVDTDRLTSTASLQDIQNAINAHKIPVAMLDGLYPATISDRGSDITAYLFEAIVNNRILSIWCDHNGWNHFSRTEILTENDFSSSFPEPLGIAAAGIRSAPARSDHVHQTELPIVADVETEDCLVLYVERETNNRPSDTDLLTLEGSYYYDFSEKSWTGFYTKVTPQYGDPLQVLNNKHPSDFKINARLDTQNTTLSSWDNSRLAYAESVNEDSGSFGLIIKTANYNYDYHFAMSMIYVSEADAGKENVEFFTRYSSFSDQQRVTIKKLPDNSGLYLLYKLDNIIYSEKGETKAVAITAPDTAPKKFFVFSPWKSTDILPSSPSFETVIRKEVYPSGELPDVSADDDGKLLGVTGGVWGKVDKPSGDFAVTVNSLEMDGTCTLDKTFAQIQEAIKGSKRVFARLNYGGIIVSMPLALYNDAALIFGAPAILENKIQQFNLTVTTNTAELLVVPLLFSYQGAMSQVEMAAAPTSSMQIATKKYVDDHVAVGLSLGLTSAAVGQIAKITGVDASGKPIAWGPADMPSGEDSDFVITGSLTEAGGITLDKTFAQIQEAVQAGKTALMRVDGGLITITLPLAVKNSEISTEYDFSIGYFIEGRLNGVTVRVMESGPVLYTASTPTNNPDGTMPQVSMASAPTTDMQIATKKYVDDKEFILQSTTPNSTKKFKITVDDTGAISAVEVTT